jgi:hypothetical protein
MDWWFLYAYNISNGERAVMGIVNSPFKPSDKMPFYYERPIYTKWVKAFDADISSGDFKVGVRKKI